MKFSELTPEKLEELQMTKNEAELFDWAVVLCDIMNRKDGMTEIATAGFNDNEIAYILKAIVFNDMKFKDE